MIFIYYLLIGMFAGFLAGLMGIGGGIIVVPALVFSFHLFGFEHSVLMHLAVGTSLAIMIFTVSISAFSHYRLGNIDFSIFYKLLPGTILGVITGTLIANFLPSDWLRYIFIVFLFVAAWRLFTLQADSDEKTLPGRIVFFLLSYFQCVLAALLGIGGSTIMVPVLVWLGVNTKKAISTCSLCNLPVALFGTLGFMLIGQHINELPSHAIGFVYLPAFLGIMLGSVVFTPLGAKLTTVLPSKLLQNLFAAFLILVALSMIFI